MGCIGSASGVISGAPEKSEKTTFVTRTHLCFMNYAFFEAEIMFLKFIQKLGPNFIRPIQNFRKLILMLPPIIIKRTMPKQKVAKLK
jgi:hypothetical protein